MLLNLLKNNLLFQNLASWIFSRPSPLIEHNIGKYFAIKKAFYITALEKLDGDYLEFGVFTGSSFVFANRTHRRMRAIADVKTKFYGFDSFTGFGAVAKHDQHPFYLDSIFAVNAEKVIRNIKRKSKGNEVVITQGFFEDTVKGKTAASFGIEKTRILFIDCDLKDPARIALDFVLPTIQDGTILIMDDFFSYKGRPELGVNGAFLEFQAANPQFNWRLLYHYGYGGVAYIASRK